MPSILFFFFFFFNDPAPTEIYTLSLHDALPISCGSAVGASTVPDVPQLDTASPGVIAPTPAAPQALSAPPPTTGVPATRPVRTAASLVTRPSTSDDPPTVGSSDASRSTACNISGLQRKRTGSNSR